MPQSMAEKAGYGDEVVGQIGNLILVPSKLKSEKLGDREFAEKKSILAAERVSLPPDVAKAKNWGPSEIAERTHRMAKRAYEIWKI